MFKKIPTLSVAILLSLGVITQANANVIPPIQVDIQLIKEELGYKEYMAVAVVDTNEVFRMHPVPTVLFDGLKIKHQQNLETNAEAKKISEELVAFEKAAIALQENSGKMKKAQFEREKNRIKKGIQALKVRKEKADTEAIKVFEKEVQQKKEEAIKLLQQEISEFSKLANVGLVLEAETINPVFVNEKTDITQGVIQYIKQKYSGKKE